MEIIPSLFLFFITLSLFTSPIQSHSSGFTTNLIHRDSPLSPYYNSSMSYSEILRNSIRRSMTRTSRIFAPKLASSTPPGIQSPFTAVPGEYLMKISVGSPPQDFLAVVDTASDLTWIQCNPCSECYPQDSPLFDPGKSSTYMNQQCQSKACQSYRSSFCDHDKNFCNYKVGYGDGSSSEGDISSDSFTFESPSGNQQIFPNVSFGCGHKNSGKFHSFFDGIVGLGYSDVSIVNQLSDTINGKFSYCMVPLRLNVSSTITFGSMVNGSGVQATPMWTTDPGAYYYLHLESVSIGVGDENLKIETKKYRNKANDTNEYENMIIDSGTTVTIVPLYLYHKIENELKRRIPADPVEGREGLGICYINGEAVEENVPTITFHFTGADWELGLLNTMVEIEDGVTCLAIAPGGSAGPAIFGNLQQMNYLVGYDLDSMSVSFVKDDCRLHV